MRYRLLLRTCGFLRGLRPLESVTVRFSILFFITMMSVSRAEAQAAGAWRPEGPWNGMQIKYSISGVNVTSTEEGGPFCCWIRTVKGDLPASGTIRVSGSVGMVSGLYANAAVRVSAGSESKEWSGVVDSQKDKWADFDVAVDIPPGATTASVSISMTGTYGSAAAGESRGISVVGSFAREGTPVPAPVITAAKPSPKPATPKPVASKGSNLDEAADAIDDFIDRFKDSCFGQTSGFSLGDKNKFRSAVKTDLVIEDNTDTAKAFLKERKTANASTYPSKTRLGEPLPTTMILPFKIPAGSQKKTADQTNRQTLWHETVHHIEILHGDRDQADNWHAAFRERNGAYLDAVNLQLQALANVESKLKKQEDETEEAWNERKQSLLEGIEGMSDEFKQIEAGAETTKVGLKFADGDTKKQWPPDLKQLRAWTGIKVSWKDILDHYATGACGDDLKLFALSQLAKGGGAQIQLSVDEQAVTPVPIEEDKPPRESQVERVLFQTDNNYGVKGGSLSPIFKLEVTSTITTIITYHLNMTPDVQPGTIGLVDEDGIIYGPWKAQMKGGVYYEINPNIKLKPGRYRVIDSDQKTWAQNPLGAGITVVKGFP